MNIKETYKKMMLPSMYVSELQKRLSVKSQTIEEYISKNEFPKKHKSTIIEITKKWIEKEKRCKEIMVK